MGVRGLTSYVMGCQWSCSEHVDLSAGGVRSNTEAKESVLLAVDGSALIYHVMQNPGEHELHLDLGCDYLALRDALLDYLSDFTRAGITSVVVVDGMQDSEKEATTLDRRRTQALEASAMMECISPDRGGHDSTADLPSSHFASLLPLFATETLAAACDIAGVACRAAEREADPELAALCHPAPRQKNAHHFSQLEEKLGAGSSAPTPADSKEKDPPPMLERAPAEMFPEVGARQAAESLAGDHRQAFRHPVRGSWRARGCCGAVVSNDSDFLVMDVPGYIPFWSLAVGEDGSAGALIFRRSMVAARLGIPPDRMPDLACLVGNDWIEPDSRVHRIIVDEANGNNTNTNNTKKKRKGATKTSRDGTRSAAPPRARDLVEATGRYLSRFYGDNPPARTRVADDELSRLLCARFFPALEDAEKSIARGVTSRFAMAGKQAAGSAYADADVFVAERFMEACCTDESVAKAVDQSRNDAAATTPLSKKNSRGAKCKKSKTRSQRGAGAAAGVKGLAGGERAGGEDFVHRDGAVGIEGHRPHASEASAGRGLGVGDTFLKDFRAAKLHYQKPNDISGDVVGLNLGRSDPVEAATETLHDVGSSARQGLSRVGLRAGISAPPELAQAVLEGVFWCRVMLEDGDDARGEPVGAVRPSAPPPLPHSPGSSISYPPPATRPPIDSSSAFGRLSAVRANLYALCLSILLGGDSSSNAGPVPAHDAAAADDVGLKGGSTSHTTMDGRSSANAGSERASDIKAAHDVGLGGGTTTGPGQVGAGVSVPSSDADRVDLATVRDGNSGPKAGSKAAPNIKAAPEVGLEGGASRGPDTFRGGVSIPSSGADGVAARARPLREGDEWMVTEFRRVGESVKPVQVFCQVPPPLRLSPLGTDDGLRGFGGVDGLRWKACLSALGLGGRDNRLLVDFVVSEARPRSAAVPITFLRTADRRNRGAEPSQAAQNKTCCGPTKNLASVALVIAVLLNASAITPSTPSTYTDSPACSGSTHPIPVGQQRRCCLERIAFAFVAAATWCAHPCHLAHENCCCARDDPAKSQATDEQGAGGGQGHPSPGNRSVLTHEGREGGGGSCRPSPRNPSDLAGQISGKEHVDSSRECVGSANGCLLETSCPHACGCTCIVQPRAGLDTDEKDTYGCRQKAVCAPPQGLRRPRAGTNQGPRSASSVQYRSESDLPDLRERNASPGGVADGGYSEKCERCASAQEGAVEGEGNAVTRHFVSLWGQVQCTVWHVNACLGVLGLAKGHNGSGGDGGGGGVVLDPMRLRPPLAREIFKRRTHHNLVGSRPRVNSNQADGAGQWLAASPTALRGVTSPQAESTTAESWAKPCKRRMNGTAPPGGSKTTAESVINMSKGRVHEAGTRGWENLGRDKKQQSERRLPGGGVEGSEQLERRHKEEHDMPPGNQRPSTGGVVEGCGGNCQWARRVRKVLRAVGSVDSR